MVQRRRLIAPAKDFHDLLGHDYDGLGAYQDMCKSSLTRLIPDGEQAVAITSWSGLFFDLILRRHWLLLCVFAYDYFSRKDPQRFSHGQRRLDQASSRFKPL